MFYARTYSIKDVFNKCECNFINLELEDRYNRTIRY